MINLRQRIPDSTPDFRFTEREYANAVMRAYGNSESFPWGHITRDLSVIGNLSDVSLIFFDVEDDGVIDTINSFSDDELLFSRMTGETFSINPAGCLISKNDILYSYLRRKSYV